MALAITSRASMEQCARPSTRRGTAFSGAAALCSALYLFPYKWASELAPPHVLAFALLVAAALLNSLLASFEQSAPRDAPAPSTRTHWQTVGTLSLLTISGNFCGARAINELAPSLVSVLLRTEVVFVGVLAAIVLRERLTPALVVGAMISLLGLGVMRWPLPLGGSASAMGWALGAALSFGAMQVVTRRVIHGISPARVNAHRMWLAASLLALTPGILEAASRAGTAFWIRVAAAALFGPCLGRLFIMYSLRGLFAAQSALILLSAPVFAFALDYVAAAFALGTPPGTRALGGAALMLLGVALPLAAKLLAGPAANRGARRDGAATSSRPS